MTYINKTKCLFSSISILAVTSASNAAVIIWGDPVGFTDSISTDDIISGISTTITDHDRFNAPGGGTAFQGDATGADITGITFNDGAIGTGNTTFTAANLGAALDGFDSGTSTGNTTPLYNNDTLTFTGLTEGATYQVQLFFSDQRFDPDTRLVTWDDGNGNTVTLSNSGEYAIGTFIADASGEAIITGGGVSGTVSDDGTFTQTGTIGGDLNLSVLAEVAAVPEPSSTALLGLGGLALILHRNKK